MICATCIEPGANSCLSCKNGLYLYKSTCVYACPAGSYLKTQTGECHGNGISSTQYLLETYLY